MQFQQKTEPVSTHSRLKAAADRISQIRNAANVSTHSRLKAAGKNVDGSF